MISNRSGGGGAATQAGVNYQNRTAAWIAAHVLAERDVPTPPEWNLSHDTTLDYLRCETEQPVDDLLVGTSAGGHIFIQVKHSLRREAGKTSGLASVFGQFVRQFMSYRDGERSAGGRPWERPLDPDRDRLVIVTGPESSAPIREGLPSLLGRLRSLAPGQPLADAATNDQERGLLRVIQDHIALSWRDVLGAEPTEGDLRELLRLVSVQILDVDENGRDEGEAKNLLRSSVIENPDHASFAWNALIQACANYASARSGGDRGLIQKKLLDDGIPLKSPRSYRVDIERLRRYSREIIEDLSDLSKIPVNQGEEVKIRRRSTEALRSAAEEGAIVVVGDPGSGKSGALHDLADELIQEERDVIFLAVDRLDARNPVGLRQELGLENDIKEILKNWPGQRPGFIITDAFDAARSDAAARTLRELLADALGENTRWRVVASIRKFDLRHDTRLQRLFAGRPPTEFQNPLFWNIRHLNVPLLDEKEELSQIRDQSPSLAALVDGAGADLRQLLRTPFNLRLVGELLGAGSALESLTPIRTQIELLDKYWQERVVRDDHLGDAREAVLRHATQLMVERRALRINRAEVTDDESTSRVLTDILSSNVMSEWQPVESMQPNRYILAFAHHLLFDYAAARLLLRGLPETVISLLEQDPELVVAIRPSLVLHFHHEWWLEPDHRSFWELVFHMTASESIPNVGKLIGPSVAADLVSNLDDCAELIAGLARENASARNISEQALRHLFGALMVEPDRPDRPLVGPHSPPWCQLLECCTMERALRLSVAYTIRPVLMAATDRAAALTDNQRRAAGLTARRLFECAWAQNPVDQWLTSHALQAICLTFESDPEESARLVRWRLEPAQIAAYGHIEIQDLANQVKRLVHLDSALVEDIYRAAFTYHEESDAATGTGSGRILNLISNRKQDYDFGLYLLADNYPEFLNVSPLRALNVLLDALSFYVASEHAPRSGEAVEEVFDFNGREAFIRTDYGAIWDSGGVHDEQGAIKMLDAWEEYVKRVGAEPSGVGELRKMVELIVSRNRLAAMWRRLILIGVELPQTLGREIAPLTWAMPILTSYDTSAVAGELLSKIFSSLDTADRERIERAILAIPEDAGEDYFESATRRRNRLLGCLPADSVVTDEAKEILRELEAQGGAPPNEPPFHPGGVVTMRYTERDYLAEQGVPVEAEANRRVQEMAQPVEEFASRHRNSSAGMGEVEQILPMLLELRATLTNVDAEGIHPKQRDAAWAHLVEACGAVAKAEELDCAGAAGSFAREILLEGSNDPIPELREEPSSSFDEHPMWGTPAPRVDATQGLMLLARRRSCTNEIVLAAIERLSHDPVPAVRFQVAALLTSLYESQPELMWQLFEQMSREDESRGVLQGVLGYSLKRIAAWHPDRSTELAETVFERIREGKGAKEVRKICSSIFTGLYVWQGNERSAARVFEIADDPAAHSDVAQNMVFEIRGALTTGPVEPSDPKQDDVRRRAFDLLLRILSAARDELRRLEVDNNETSFDHWSPEAQERTRKSLQLIGWIAKHLYFASGAFDNKRSGSDARENPPLGIAEKGRFLEQAGPLLDALSDIGIPRITHDLVQTLEHLIEFDPAGVFLRLGRVVRAGTGGHYQYESMAAQTMVRVVERFLAEYRSLLREREDCRRALIEILDTFVEVGWPDARRLAYRTEEIFR